MRIEFAHLRERASNGGWINYAVFNARTASCSQTDNQRLLMQLTEKARAANLRVDQSALMYATGGHLQFFGTRPLVDHLAKTGAPRWTHHLDV